MTVPNYDCFTTSRWHESTRIRAFIQAPKAAGLAAREKLKPGSELVRWIEWAVDHAVRIDPLTDGQPTLLDNPVQDQAAPWATF